MRYSHIYEQFIADRRSKKSEVEAGYFERHHILPKCLGGSDAPENLISLSFIDHFRAHILLARIHGGRMTYALSRMLAGHEGKLASSRSAKKYVTLAKLLSSQARALDMKKRWQDPVYASKNKLAQSAAVKNLAKTHTVTNGARTVMGTVADLVDLLDTDEWRIYSIVSGRVLKTKDGWWCPLHNPEGISVSDIISKRMKESNPSHRSEVRQKHRDIARRPDRQEQFAQIRQLCYTQESAKKRQETIKSRYSKEERAEWLKDRTFHTGKSHHNFDPTLRTWRRKEDGFTIVTTINEMRKNFPNGASNWSKLVRGKLKSVQGWELVQ